MSSVIDRHVQAITAEASAAVTDPVRWTTCVEAISAATGAQGASLFHPLPAPQGGVIAAIGSMAATSAYFSKWIKADPWSAGARSKGNFRHAGEIRFGYEFVDDGALLRSDYYEGHGRHHGSGHKLCLKVLANSDPLIAPTNLTLNRSFDEKPFSEQDKFLLQRIRAPLHIAMQNYLRLRDGPAQRHISEMNLALLPAPIFVVRRNGQVDYANPAAEALCTAYPWIVRSTGRIVRVGNCDDAGLVGVLERVCRGVGTQLPFVYRDHVHRPRQGLIAATPLAQSPVFSAAWPHAQVLLTLTLPTDVDRIDWVDEIANLTPQQRVIVRHLADGQGVRDIAERLGIAVDTLKTHLRNIYARTGCTGQAQLVRMALTGAPPS